MTNIHIKEVIEDKNTLFNIKRFKISNTDFNEPVKTLDVKRITRQANHISQKTDFQLKEVSKKVDAERIQKIIDTSDDGKLNNYFEQKPALGISPDTINLTFTFNPYNHFSNVEKISGFFDLYYEHSRTLLTIPNIRMKTKNKSIISIPDYLKFVDSVFTILNTKNNKPIFVPISLKTSQEDIKEICKHYLKNEYFNFWIDFDGSAVSNNTLARLRHLFRLLKDEERFNDTICYFTNIKREISSNAKKDKSPASDILAAVAGANIIGVNREPVAPFNSTNSQKFAPHKSRILDRTTYYYNKTDNIVAKDVNVTQNSMEIKNELNKQTEIILNGGTVIKYLKNKPMLRDKNDIMKSLTVTSFKKIDNWF